jgi:hypothetical protein
MVIEALALVDVLETPASAPYPGVFQFGRKLLGPFDQG